MEIKLQFSNAYHPIGYEQVKRLRSFENFKYPGSNSQLMKRLENKDFENIIKNLEAGESIIVID